ncbi:MAG: ShlB/FhaC/HecB family hemolysin secretion/activation protein [Phycisphaerales bacterium]
MQTKMEVRAERRVLDRWTAALLCLLAGHATALAQTQPAEPMDVNAVQPGSQPAAAGVAPQTSAPNAAAESKPAPNDATDDGSVYPISKFTVAYANPGHPDHPAVDQLLDAEVELAVLPGGYARPAEGRSTVKMKLRDLAEGGGGNFYWSAIAEAGATVVRELNARGIIACYVTIPGLANDAARSDKRDGSTEMQLVVVTGVVAENGVRTVARGERLASVEQVVNPDDPVHHRILRQSPVAAGDLVSGKKLDRYLFALNRHPGRRVDLAIAAGEKEGEVNVDYLVAENKPWTLFAQVSNTGTAATGEWRERFGYSNTQLTGNDDILRLDYVTGNFDSAHAVSASYQFPLISDRMWIRPFVSWSQFSAADLGTTDLDYEGDTTTLGTEISGNVYQHRNLFVDVFGGARYVDTAIQETGNRGEGYFLIPYIGVRAERYSEESVTLASVSIETNINDWAGTSNLESLGREDIDEYWTLFKWSGEHSFFLEPLFNSQAWRGESNKGTKTLAHEIALSCRGQYSPRERLPPMEEEVAGGAYSVRGYSESATAGDSVVIASLEYRFHVPRAFGVAEPGVLGKRRLDVFGSDFRWAPQTEFGRTDWDLIFRGFFDIANVYVAQQNRGDEPFNTLVGTGVGLELQVRRNFSARLDWGVALNQAGALLESRPDSNGDTYRSYEYGAGDTQLHFSATIMY